MAVYVTATASTAVMPIKRRQKANYQYSLCSTHDVDETDG
jgi:hypothetical protein